MLEYLKRKSGLQAKAGHQIPRYVRRNFAPLIHNYTSMSLFILFFLVGAVVLLIIGGVKKSKVLIITGLILLVLCIALVIMLGTALNNMG